jgi:hypothetical protein
MTFASAPLARGTTAPSPAQHNAGDQGLKAMLQEARGLRDDREVVKSNSSAALLLLIIRVLETITGEPLTALPVRNAHPEDDEPPPQPSLPRRL